MALADEPVIEIEPKVRVPAELLKRSMPSIPFVIVVAPKVMLPVVV